MKVLSVVLPAKAEPDKVGQVADNAAITKYVFFRQAAGVRGSNKGPHPDHVVNCQAAVPPA